MNKESVGRQCMTRGQNLKKIWCPAVILSMENTMAAKVIYKLKSNSRLFSGVFSRIWPQGPFSWRPGKELKSTNHPWHFTIFVFAIDQSLQDSAIEEFSAEFRLERRNCTKFTDLAQKIAEKQTFHGTEEIFHFLSIEFPCLSMEFPLLTCRISIFWA